MKITWYGTASVEIESEGRKILFDPFVQLPGAAHPNSPALFADNDVIFITHGHFDHLYPVPALLAGCGPTVFCGSAAAKTLEKYAEDTDTVCVIRPGMEIPAGPFLVRVYRGKHAEFDFSRKNLREALTPSDQVRHAKNLPFILLANARFPERGETFVYGIEAEGKQILLAGSMNFAPASEETYPDSPDLLVLPYQGLLDLEGRAQEMIDRVHPKRIMLSHFDDAFPPVSRNVDLRGLERLLKERYPGIRTVKPAYRKPVHL